MEWRNAEWISGLCCTVYAHELSVFIKINEPAEEKSERPRLLCEMYTEQALLVRAGSGAERDGDMSKCGAVGYGDV